MHNIQWIVCEDYEQLSAAAGHIFERQIIEKPGSVLGLATGDTPLGLYDFLADRCRREGLDFSRITTFNLDEYYPMQPDHPQSYRRFMDEHLFARVNIRPAHTFVPNGAAADPQAACRDYEALLDRMGGIDLQLLGVGHNGHIGFNEPGDRLVAFTHVTDLTQRTLQANARFFNSIDEVPRRAITMGMGTILKARAIVCLIAGADKHPVVEAMQTDWISPACPATFLKLHANVTVICDRKAYEG